MFNHEVNDLRVGSLVYLFCVGHTMKSGADPEKKEGGGGGGGGELCLDWYRSYLAPMKYCPRFMEETSTPLGAE